MSGMGAKAAVGPTGKMPPAADIQGLELIRLSGFKTDINRGEALPPLRW
jgi:hypothetical protein